MKQRSKYRNLLRGSAVALFTLLSLAAVLLSSFRSRQLPGDVWKMLGVSKQVGDEGIQNSFYGGYLYTYGVKNLKNIAVDNRAGIAKDLLDYTRAFVEAPAFKKQYEKWRNESRPVEPEKKRLRTIEEIQKDEIAKTEKSIRETEKNMKEAPQFAKAMEPVLEMLKKNLKEQQDPKNEYFTSIAMGEKYEQESRERSYKENMERWEKDFPSDMNVFIATRLQRMLDDTKDIDYSAELVEKWGKKRFVKSEYEGKNTAWKQGFRAGKEVTEQARAFARKWLDDLKAKK